MFLPLHIRISKFRVLVIGGGEVAFRKIELLLQYKAAVTVIAPRVISAVERLAGRKKVKLLRRAYRSSDVDRADIIYACSDDRALNARIARQAEKKHKLCNNVSDSAMSGFISPAVIDKAGVSIGISTAGRNPAYAAAAREQIQAWLAKHKEIPERKKRQSARKSAGKRL